LLVIVVLAISSGYSVFRETFDPYPLDEEVIDSFQRNRSSFESLVALFKVDSQLFSIDIEGHTRGENMQPLALPESRRVEYINLMKMTGTRDLYRHISSPEDKTIYCQMWAAPNVFIGGKSKHIV